MFSPITHVWIDLQEIPFRRAIFACIGNLILAASCLAQTYTWQNVYTAGGGGFTPGIIFNESEPGLVYAREDIGGVYRLDKLTRCWIPITDSIGPDDWNLTGIVSLATDPVNPNNVYLAAGTYTNLWTSQNGAILKSTNRGATWTRTMLPFKLGGNMPGRGSGERLAIDPNNNNILYLAAGGDDTSIFGLWKSTNAGDNWSQVTGFTAQGNWKEDAADVNQYLNQYQGLWWVVFDKRSGTPGTATQTLYVGVATKTGPTIWRSTNGGSTWAAVPNQPLADCAGNLIMPKKAKLDTVNGFLYVTYGFRSGPYQDEIGEVFKYNTATGVWTNISPMANACVVVGGDGQNPYFGYNGLTIDRQNPNIIMVTGYSSWWPDTFIWRSVNGGASWSAIWSWTSYPNRSYRYVANSSGGVGDVTAVPWLDLGPTPQSGGRPGPDPHPKLGWMTETCEIDPFNSNRFMYATGMTIYGADDLLAWDPSTTAQIHLKPMSQGIEETSVLALISPPSGAPLISGMGDIAGFRHTDLTVVPTITIGVNPSWATTTGLDFAEANTNFVVRVGNPTSSNNPNPQASGQAGAYSTNNGQTWTPFSSQPVGVTSGRQVAVNATGTRILWSPEGTTSAYVSSNNGQAWTAVTGMPANSPSAQPSIASDRMNGNKFYAFLQGRMYYSSNGGSSFAASATTGIPTDNVKVKAVFGREGEVWAAGGASNLNAYGLWHSSDSGLTYTKIANVEGAENVTFGKPAVAGNYPVIFISGTVGGVRGIFKSEDVGASWTRINDDAHQFGIFGQPALCGDPRIYGRVYVATNGRGIFIGDLAGGVQMASPAAPGALTATAVSTSQINLTWADNSTNESTFVVDYATNVSFTTGLVTISPGYNVTGCQVSGLSPSTTYFFRVRAVNRDSSSANSATASATTQSLPTAPPAAPTNLTAATASASAINLSWVDNSNNEGNFVIQRATDSAFTANVVSTTIAANTASTQIGGLTNNTTYYFRVQAINVVGASAYSNTASAKTSRR